MDRIISKFPYENEADLNVCYQHGIAYQRDMANLVKYDGDYFQKCLTKYEIPQKRARNMVINGGRISFIQKHFGSGAVLDIGVGAGAFIRNRLECGAKTFGLDINEQAIAWLHTVGLYSDNVETFQAFSMWDVLEHIPDPGVYLDRIPMGAYLFVSVPIWNFNFSIIRDWKHYRPGEHLYYFADRPGDMVLRRGFQFWMSKRGFELLEKSDFEERAGRKDVASYAFKRTKKGD